MEQYSRTAADINTRVWRIWDDQKPLIMFVGLNPSTANEKYDPPRQKICIGGVYMMNLFAWVTPYPEELITSENSIGENDMLRYPTSAVK